MREETVTHVVTSTNIIIVKKMQSTPKRECTRTYIVKSIAATERVKERCIL